LAFAFAAPFPITALAVIFIAMAGLIVRMNMWVSFNCFNIDLFIICKNLKNDSLSYQPKRCWNKLSRFMSQPIDTMYLNNHLNSSLKELYVGAEPKEFNLHSA
jgi:hypothetical protein